MKGNKKEFSPKQREELLSALKTRFEKNMNRHKGLEWPKVQARLEANAEKLWALHEMERTGGEPDVVGHDKKTGEYIFYDCSAESPKGRRSVCYDREALESRKEHKPKDSAVDMAAAIGIELLTEEQYRELQKLGDFDTKTSSWVKTPENSAAPSIVIAATTLFSCLTTVRNPTMPLAGSVAGSGSSGNHFMHERSHYFWRDRAGNCATAPPAPLAPFSSPIISSTAGFLAKPSSPYTSGGTVPEDNRIRV